MSRREAFFPIKVRFFRKLDIVIIILLLLAVVAGFCLLSDHAPGTSVKITKNGVLIGIYPLSQDNFIVIDTHNSVQIENGRVRMNHSDCPDGYCLKMGEIIRGNIICLPNRVVVEILSDAAPDAIAGVLR